MNKNILITGGAGYIGSHTVRFLLDKGFNVIVLDSLEKGTKNFLPKEVNFYNIDLRDKSSLGEVFSKEKIDAVIHFAGYIEAGESVKDPLKYYENNVCSSIVLLECMHKSGVKKIVYSSSAAVYGAPLKVPITEEEPKEPVNPYGESKLMVEKILEDLSSQELISYVALRYFNAAGASYSLGENHEPESHLIPLLLQTALGKRDCFNIYGNDYDTRDGTCERDFIHVLDLAKAHYLALVNLLETGKSNQFNAGTSKGYTVNEIIKAAEIITGKKINTKPAKRREGDPPKLIADCEKIKKELGWEAEKDIDEIIRSAYEWEIERNS